MVVLEAEDLEHVRRRLAVPAWITHSQGDCDSRAFFDQLRRLEARSLPAMLIEEVDHLLAVASDRRCAVDSAAGDAEPLPFLREEVAECARVAAVQRGERLFDAPGALAHAESVRAARLR